MLTSMQKKMVAIAAILVGAGVVGYAALGGVENNLVYYFTPAELIAKADRAQGMQVRLGGMVERGSIHWNPNTLQLDFRLTSDPSKTTEGVAVHATGAPPQMFQENMGAVVEGRFDGHVFQADRVMVKHSNEYRAPKNGEHPANPYSTLLPADK